MDIKDLNKSQLILLAILLSFITSIATGITTVTLMQQAPTSVTVPINRVVRQTVEKIQQIEGKTITQTVVVKEEDLVVDAIAKNKAAIFSITKEIKDAEGNNLEQDTGKGFLVSDDGVIVADGSLVSPGDVYYLKNDSGKFKAEFVSIDKNGFSFLKAGEPVNEKDKFVVSLPTFGDLSKVKTGQKIIVLGGSISSFIYNGDKDIKINVTKSNSGGMVLNLDGEVLGIALSNDIASFVPIEIITEVLKAKEIKIETKTPTP